MTLSEQTAAVTPASSPSRCCACAGSTQSCHTVTGLTCAALSSCQRLQGVILATGLTAVLVAATAATGTGRFTAGDLVRVPAVLDAWPPVGGCLSRGLRRTCYACLLFSLNPGEGSLLCSCILSVRHPPLHCGSEACGVAVEAVTSSAVSTRCCCRPGQPVPPRPASELRPCLAWCATATVSPRTCCCCCR